MPSRFACIWTLEGHWPLALLTIYVYTYIWQMWKRNPQAGKNSSWKHQVRRRHQGIPTTTAFPAPSCFKITLWRIYTAHCRILSKLRSQIPILSAYLSSSIRHKTVQNRKLWKAFLAPTEAPCSICKEVLSKAYFKCVYLFLIHKHFECSLHAKS